MWHMLPIVCRRQLYSTKLVNLQFALVLVGLVGFFVVLTTAGLIQGTAWNSGEGVYRVLPGIAVYMALRAALGVFIFSAAAIGLYNVIMTLRRGQPIPAEAAERTDAP
jgi:cytochrome c oxidase cbb3-type subunit I